MRHARILVPLLLFALSSRIAAAQAITVNGSVLLSGSNAPAAQAVVDFTGPERARAVTIGDGTFYIASLATGTYKVVITYQGSVKRSLSMSVSAGTNFTFYINP